MMAISYFDDMFLKLNASLHEHYDLLYRQYDQLKNDDSIDVRVGRD